MEWERLVREHLAWEERNFPGENLVSVVEGVVEELGELAHSHLKEKQGIRGVPSVLQEEARDAIADLTIYMLGVMSRTGIRPRKLTSDRIHQADFPDTALLRLAVCVGRLCDDVERYTRLRRWQLGQYRVDSIIHYCRAYCELRDWDYDQIVEDTWLRVSKRNWVADPVSGGHGS